VPPALPSARVPTWQALAAPRPSQAVSQQGAEPPAQAHELAQVAARAAAQAQVQVKELVQPVALVRERLSKVAVQRAATQHLGKGAAQHNRTTLGTRRLRLLKW
jgi:hypothetical protein